MTSPETTTSSAQDADIDDTDVVDVAVPARVVYVSTLRRTAASLAAGCDLTVDDIEDLRLAVDEACSLLLPHAGGSTRLESTIRLGQGSIAVTTSVATDDAAEPDRSGFAWTVLDALSSTVDVSAADGRLAITVTKNRQAAPR